mgnify:CR=1 FL=1
MDTLIISASPNKDGLTADCANAASEGVRQAHGTSEQICLNDHDIGLCAACANGWGTCWEKHTCQVEDDFQPLHQRVARADGYVVVSPVYFGQMSEIAKAFFDRLRRCEATRGQDSALAQKPVLGVAAAGGSGGGIISCLEEMNRLFGHLRADVFDLIPVTQKSRAHKTQTIQQASRRMVGEDA